MGASAKSRHTPRKTLGSSHPKKPVKPNASILSFFKKAEKKEASLFIGTAPDAPSHEDDIYADDSTRYNESDSPNKKRRISEEETPETTTNPSISVPDSKPAPEPITEHSYEAPKKAKHRVFTPFAMDSDSEDDRDEDDDNDQRKTSQPTVSESLIKTPIKSPETPQRTENSETDSATSDTRNILPILKHEDSVYAQFDNLDDADGMIEALEDDLLEGEELRAMRYMREQARLEADEAGNSTSEDIGDDSFDDSSPMANCPICESSLAGISLDVANQHVNSCLDGNPIPIPRPTTTKAEAKPTAEITEFGKRFSKAAIPRPAQANPLESATSDKAPKSIFSKLMSTNAEDSAWAVAAAEANASRGRPAHLRTCPFYKIMPGFSICVDAFRYGAVEGCKAYFLSHFHSDHYIGLTAKWCHGPIYCSKVTGSLVKKQLRTAAEWVVELEFDKSYDIPGTGASVTMIPANHCPGSSLFLFEKPQGTSPNSRPKRILHCGDFRACPDHVGHPLLRADVKDAVSGKVRQQKIDICYLDTTYLNPRYSFPPQNDVIKACADLVASLSSDPDMQDDILEKSALDLGTPAVSKYFSKAEASSEEASTAASKKPKQRLLVICGTYSIGKERICIAIAKALGSKIFASPAKIRICKQLDDPELTSMLTTNPLEAQVHMQMLMEIRAETLQEYLNGYKPHFNRIVGLRPSGWNFRPANGKAITANTSPNTIQTTHILHSKGWRTRFGYKDFVRQRGSTKEAMCFGVPYSEHSSFRELAMFVMGLRIEKVIPTVNVGNEQSRKRMKSWIDKWMAERRRGGLVRPLIEGEDDEKDDKLMLWDGKSGTGGGAWW
ncbi:DNA repair metallo-beta-lactamase-domain-containing protein [Stachybotrys elegans]|uniref:DNA repair metallo-beta-lactamase-domain-containing protein n=1 Tax=Stachybotrys elegans TaxID=80388 RepID=A0A8K0SZA9_9HYPO|nr:DNA repair metallo-beta-lactamase-domain-containing protein [Stachybotrys elegans]